ncbi:baseplate J/gp47 family protein [Gorillibacterium timonense]|uniref:baseplate J/gp47 family protein n=1 Tax=Gorillibacterium timonense TaxID=1689269 RepID=UPI00071C2D2F|nr:baseplate J/gp47 family protein [Gorillibacterium timonense]
MYEDQTYEAILQRMMERVPTEVDKRQGSILFDALAPAAAELAEAYSQLDEMLRLFSASTASGEYLTRRAADDGIDRKAASPTKRRGRFVDGSGQPFDLPLGKRFSVEETTFMTEAKLAPGEYVMECETVGTTGNIVTGTMLPIEYVPGLARAELGELLVPGEDEEADDSLRQRYLDRNRNPATSGNKAQYRAWALDYPGVGGAQVLPLWAGPGTVKVVILDATARPASAALVADLQAYLDPTPGVGEGAAPLGAVVTVTAAAPVVVNLEATVSLNGSRTLAQVKAELEKAFADYLKGIAFGTDPSPKYAKIGALLLDIPGVQDYSTLKVAGAASNVPISVGQVAIAGTVNVNG